MKVSNMTNGDLDELMENLAQCRRCGICRNAVYEDRGFDGVCPVWKNSTGFETSFMRGRIQVALALLEGRLKQTPENAEAIFTCTLCGSCSSICTAEFDPAKCLETVRAVLNSIPNEARNMVTNKILRNSNPYIEDNKSRRNWTSEAGFDIPTKGEVLYFTGCTAGIKQPQTAISTARVLNSIGVDFAVLEDEPCCGSVMIRMGMIEQARENAERVLERIYESEANTILVTCAGCLKTLREDYPNRFGLKVPRVLHVVEYLHMSAKSRKFKFRKTDECLRVAWHDPCHLGRALGIYEEPRDILRSIPGIKLVEMTTNRDAAMCCGSGGGLRSFDTNLAIKIAADRVKSAEETLANVLATACPFCVHNLKEGAQIAHSKIRILDIMDLLSERIA